MYKSDPNYKTNIAAPITAATRPLPAIFAAPLVLVGVVVPVEEGPLGPVVIVPLVVPLVAERILEGKTTP